MPRELEGYRPQLELLTDMFPGRAAIGITECQAALGIDRRTLLAQGGKPLGKSSRALRRSAGISSWCWKRSRRRTAYRTERRRKNENQPCRAARI